jgi:predicted transcriptional regulator
MRPASRIRDARGNHKGDTRKIDFSDSQNSSYKKAETMQQGRLKSQSIEDEQVYEPGLIDQTVAIVSAYVSNNAVNPGEMGMLIGEVYNALSQASSYQAPVAKEELRPAVPVKKSLHPDYIICLEDGKKFKSLKRHLRTHYDMSPEEYREKWGLDPSYPMVAPNYATARSDLAKKMGLGQRRAAAR